MLDNLSFKIKAGECVGIVGASGCGKSTIMRLLYGLYDAKYGSVLIDGEDVKDTRKDDTTLQDLRSKMGVIPQDAVLFNNTILYNIAYGAISNKKPEKADENKVE